MKQKENLTHIEGEGLRKNIYTSSRKNLTLATLLAISQACNFNNDAKFGYNFVREGNKIYLDESEYDANGKVVKEDKNEMNISNPETFQVIDCFMGKDNLHVYYLAGSKTNVRIIKGANPDTFEKYPYIQDTTSNEHAGHTFYRDKDHLYDLGNVVEGVNPNTADLSSRRYNGTIQDQGHIFKWDGQKFIKIK